MTHPFSDPKNRSHGNKGGLPRATREANKAKAIEMLKDNKNKTEIASELGISRSTLYRNLAELEEAWQAGNITEYQYFKSEHLIQIEELRALAENPAIKADRKVELLLAILKEDIKLKGTAAPTKHITANVDGKLTQEYIEIASLMANVDEEDRIKVVQFIKSLVKPVEIGPECEPPTIEGITA